MNTGNPLQINSPATILLIEPQNALEECVRETLENAGYQCHYVSGFKEAAEFLRFNPEPDVLIISSDAKLNTKLSSIRDLVDIYLPVVAIGNKLDDDLLEDYEMAGVDRFITKPVNPHWLRLAVQSALRLRQLYRHETNQRMQLLSYWQQVDLEQEVAAKIYNEVLQRNYLHTDVVKKVMSPMALFNGDLLLVDRTPDSNLYMLLGDFTGHGLSASVAATPVADIFYGMARKGFALADIVQEINAKLHNMLPANRFLAATAVALYPDSKALTIITCGLPEHFLVNHSDGTCTLIHSKNIPLGIERTIELVEKHFSVTKHHHLYLATDGVFEAENLEGEAFGASRIIDAICKQPDGGIDSLRERLAEHSQGLGQQDDISFVELVCDVDDAPWRPANPEQATRSIQALRWKTAMEFDIDALRLLNPVPVIVNALMELQGLQEHRQAIFLIISELFTNALEHGVLELDSAIKATPEGFMRYYEAKETRIQSAQAGRIRLLFQHEPTEKGGRLTIKVVDSGSGFDWRERQQDLAENTGFCGRGLKLLDSLCSRLTFHGRGNRVTAVYDWRNR